MNLHITHLRDPIDALLNKITMYRLVLYYLMVLVIGAAIACFFDLLPYNPINLLASTLFLLVACWALNTLFARIFNAPTNVESVYITAFILALIVAPVPFTTGGSALINGAFFLFWLSVLSMGSKFIIALHKKHIFNPAALAVAIGSLVLGHSANWWVGGNLVLMPLVLVGGLLIVRKIQRFDLVWAYILTTLATIVITFLPQNPFVSIEKALLHSPIIFLACLMLTEPLTTPPTRRMRIINGAIVGVLFAPAVHIGALYFTPELALLVGNIFAYVVSPKVRVMLTLIKKEQIALGVYHFIFKSDQRLAFAAGQYLEWTLPHEKPDARGNRRYFTIASSPTESEIHLGVKVYEPASTFKKGLLALTEGMQITASQVAGEFVLPHDTKEKLVFIAGGIGITPFRSITHYMLDTRDTRSVILLYSNKVAREVAYKDIFDRAEDMLDFKAVYALTNEPTPIPGTHHGIIDIELIKKEVPDFLERTFYISGPHGMVVAFEKTLNDLGIPPSHIKVDFFPGFV